MDAETLEAVRLLRLKLKAAKGLIRDLTQCAAELERLLDTHVNAEPPEAERSDHSNEANLVAA